MTTITITIGRVSVEADMRVKSHAEAAAISSVEERYLVEAGTEKADELHQCVTDAFTEVQALLRDFVTGAASASANDAYSASGDLVLALSVQTRKASGLAAPLAGALHKYVVDSALAKFYRSVARPALAEPHERVLPADKADVNTLLYTKHDPTY